MTTLKEKKKKKKDYISQSSLQWVWSCDHLLTNGMCATLGLFSYWVPPLLYCWNVYIVVVSLLGSFRWGQYLRDNREQDWKRLGPSTISHHTCPGQLISSLLQDREVTSILFKTLLFASLLHDVTSVYETALFYLPKYVSSPSTHLRALP